MKMKNIFIIALTLIMCLTGCGKQKTSSIESENLSAVGQAVTEPGESVAVTETASTISRETENPTGGGAETRLPTEKTEHSAKPHTGRRKSKFRCACTAERVGNAKAKAC